MQRFALIGEPVAHSLSPVMHRAAYKAIGISAKYEVLPTRELTSTHPAWQYAGLSVTAPLKTAVIDYLDAVEPLARAVSAVNTVVNAGGLRTGFNTDVYGIVQAIREAKAKASFNHLLILGGRATACSAMAASGELGRPQVTVAARTLGGPGTVGPAASRLGLQPSFLPLRLRERVFAAARQADLVITTLPQTVTAELILEGLQINPAATVLECAYAPAQVSALQKSCQKQGNTFIRGELMLLHQAVQQFSLQTGKVAPTEVMRTALLKASRLENLVC